MAEAEELKYLETYAVISFDGTTPNGLRCHPDGVHIIYPVGNKICVKNMRTKLMHFLSGHTNLVSTVNVSPCGKFVGSGQFQEYGLKTLVIVWDFEKRAMIASHDVHKISVESVAFSTDGHWLYSIGGRGCDQIAAWDTSSTTIGCTADLVDPAAGDTVIVAPLNKRHNAFVTGGNGTLRVWSINLATKAPVFYNVAMGKLKRHVLSIAISTEDDFAYCGTTSGDILKITLGSYSSDTGAIDSQPAMKACYAKCGAWRKNMPRPEVVLYGSGVRCLIILDDGSLLVGAGNGLVEIIKQFKWKKPLPKTKLLSPISPDFKATKTKKFTAAITSMQMMVTKNSKDKQVLLGTKVSEMFVLNLTTFHVTLIVACHTSTINSICFPYNMSEVFASASNKHIRIWCLKTCQELLRIEVPNTNCLEVLFNADGKSILSAWGDRCIRAFKPISGKLIYAIYNTHPGDITAMAITTDGKTLVSGGCYGQVRIWAIEPHKQSLKTILKDHKGPVASIKINNTNTEAVSAGSDGSCIIWDIIKMCRRTLFFSHTIFTSVAYDLTSSQILTVGHDKTVSYWESSSGILIRELEASKNSAIFTIDIDPQGDYFITGGSDQMLKLWKYNEGIYTHLGLGHSGNITRAKFSPDGKFMVSCSTSGSIFIWKFPEEYMTKEGQNNTADPSPEPLNTPEGSKKSLPRLTKKASASSLHLSNRFSGGGGRDENISTIDTSRNSRILCLCPTNEKNSAKK